MIYMSKLCFKILINSLISCFLLEMLITIYSHLSKFDKVRFPLIIQQKSCSAINIMGNVFIGTLSGPVVRRVSKAYSFMFLMSLSPLFPPPLQLSLTKSWGCVCCVLWTVSLLAIKNKGNQTFVGIYEVVINPVLAIHMLFKPLHITSVFLF